MIFVKLKEISEEERKEYRRLRRLIKEFTGQDLAELSKLIFTDYGYENVSQYYDSMYYKKHDKEIETDVRRYKRLAGRNILSTLVYLKLMFDTEKYSHDILTLQLVSDLIIEEENK